MQQYMRQFEQMAEKESRKKKMQALKKEREASDPCKCGRARTKRLPRPLATGGPRCNKCLPLVPERGAPVLRDAETGEALVYDYEGRFRITNPRNPRDKSAGEGGRKVFI